MQHQVSSTVPRLQRNHGQIWLGVCTDLTELHANLKDAILDAQERMQVQTDWLRSAPPDIQIGSQVFVKAEFFHTTRPSKKLLEKFLGPFEVITKPGSLSYTLKLPNSMRAVQPVFHISMLEPATPNSFEGWTLPAPPPSYYSRWRELWNLRNTRLKNRWT